MKSLLRTLSELSITDSAMSLLGGVWSKVWQGQLFTDKWEEGWVPFPHTGVDRVRDRSAFPVGARTDLTIIVFATETIWPAKASIKTSCAALEERVIYPGCHRFVCNKDAPAKAT